MFSKVQERCKNQEFATKHENEREIKKLEFELMWWYLINYRESDETI